MADPESRSGPGSARLSLITPGNPRAGCERVLLEASQPCGQSCGRGRSQTQDRGSCANVFLGVQVGSVAVGVLRTAALPGPACVCVCVSVSRSSCGAGDADGVLTPLVLYEA